MYRKQKDSDQDYMNNKTPVKHSISFQRLTRNSENAISLVKEWSKNSSEKIKDTMFELPDLHIYSKPLNDKDEKFYNLENFKVLKENLSQTNEYSSGQTLIKYSSTNSLNNSNSKILKDRDRFSHSVGRRR
jgi:hypothetical protein